MARFRHLIFVCVNEREPDNPKGCCASKGSRQILDRMKQLTHEHGLKGRVRVVPSGCLDYCQKGVAAVAYSAGGPADETWYTCLTPQDAEAFFSNHVLEGKRLEGRLESKAHRYDETGQRVGQAKKAE